MADLTVTVSPEAFSEALKAAMIVAAIGGVACVRTWDALLDMYWMHQRRLRRARLRAAAERREHAHG